MIKHYDYGMQVSEQKVKIKSFTDLKAWQEGHSLVLLVYRITANFPKEEKYSIVDRMRRAASSVTANIAEGFGRQGYREKIQFYYISQGSLTELKDYFLIARDLGYMDNNDWGMIINSANQTHKILQGLISKSKVFLNLKS
jgi:four helix bundle protein